MTKIIIKGSTLVKDVPERAMVRLKAELTFKNPEYAQAKKAKRFIPKDMPEYLYYYRIRGSSIIIPRGMTGMASHILSIPMKDILDFTVSPKIKIAFTGTLRDYQKIAVDKAISRRYGILSGATGAGKTVMGTAITAKHSVKTLVIVHNKELLYQWESAFKKFTNLKSVGLIGDSKFDIKDVTIGIINSIHPKAAELCKEFGLVIYDETHRAMGNTWVKTINTLRPRFHVGLSATPYRRSTELTKALFRVVGPLVHTIDRKHLEETGAILVPRIAHVPTKFVYNYNNDYSAMLSRLTKNDDRNILVANTIINEFTRYKEPIMIVSDRVSHCEDIEYLLKGEAGLKPVVVHGKLGKKVREEAIQGLRDGKYNALIATVSLLGEGFDAPDLNAIFLTTPMRFSGRLIQSIGRILRPSKGGFAPRVYDFRDYLVKVLRNSGFARDRVYNKHGWNKK